MAEGMRPSAEEIQQRLELVKVLRKSLRRTARHLEKTGLTRTAAIVTAGEMHEMRITESDVTNVVSLDGKRKTKKLA